MPPSKPSNRQARLLPSSADAALPRPRLPAAGFSLSAIACFSPGRPLMPPSAPPPPFYSAATSFDGMTDGFSAPPPRLRINRLVIRPRFTAAFLLPRPASALIRKDSPPAAYTPSRPSKPGGRGFPGAGAAGQAAREGGKRGGDAPMFGPRWNRAGRDAYFGLGNLKRGSLHLPQFLL